MKKRLKSCPQEPVSSSVYLSVIPSSSFIFIYTLPWLYQDGCNSLWTCIFPWLNSVRKKKCLFLITLEKTRCSLLLAYFELCAHPETTLASLIGSGIWYIFTETRGGMFEAIWTTLTESEWGKIHKRKSGTFTRKRELDAGKAEHKYPLILYSQYLAEYPVLDRYSNKYLQTTWQEHFWHYI